MNKVTHSVIGFLGCMLLSVVSGCDTSGQGEGIAGYRTGSTFPKDVRTVAVPIFENESFYREVEFELTEALIKEIESRTPYKVTAGNVADTVLTGTITSINQDLLSRTETGAIPQELQLVVVASFQWKNQRTGQIVRARSYVEGTGEYIPTASVDQPLAIARHKAVSELAEAIVSIMRDDW